MISLRPLTLQEKGAVIVYLPETGQKIKQLRIQRNISQIAPAKQLGVSKSVISSYENEIHHPPYDVLPQMARPFGAGTDYLLGASNNRTISADGLTDTQIEAITMTLNELRETNRGSRQYRPLEEYSNGLLLSLSLPGMQYPGKKARGKM